MLLIMCRRRGRILITWGSALSEPVGGVRIVNTGRGLRAMLPSRLMWLERQEDWPEFSAAVIAAAKRAWGPLIPSDAEIEAASPERVSS
jgi:hypothetical protein